MTPFGIRCRRIQHQYGLNSTSERKSLQRRKRKNDSNMEDEGVIKLGLSLGYGKMKERWLVNEVGITTFSIPNIYFNFQDSESMEVFKFYLLHHIFLRER